VSTKRWFNWGPHSIILNILRGNISLPNSRPKLNIKVFGKPLTVALGLGRIDVDSTASVQRIGHSIIRSERMKRFFSRKKNNVVAFSRQRRLLGKVLPSRQSQRQAILQSRRNSIRALSKSMHWIMEGLRKASLKTLALIALAFLRIFRCPLKIAGVICRLAAVVLPLVGLYLYFNPYAKMTPLLWQRGVMWEAYAFAGAALWVWLETVLLSTESKLNSASKALSAA
jgi:hypothetical protein